MDGILGLILDTLDLKNLSDSVNVIVTSDHGMADVDMENRVGLSPPPLSLLFVCLFFVGKCFVPSAICMVAVQRWQQQR